MLVLQIFLSLRSLTFYYSIGCGKGGDLQKWQRAGVNHVVGVDIAATSIEQCKDRYRQIRELVALQ